MDDEAINNAIEAAVYDMNAAFGSVILEDAIEVPVEAHAEIEVPAE